MKMKRKILTAILLIATVASVSSCKKIIKAIFPGFETNIPVIKLTLPPIVVVTPEETKIGTYTQHFNLDSVIRANTSGAFNESDVSSIKVKTIVFTILNPDQLNNLVNFESVRFTFSSNANTNPAQIAAVNFPDEYQSTIT